jgi:hexokinase
VDAFLTSSEFFDGLDSGPDSAKSATVHLGLTFSFPVEQSALASGVLLTWTKGFAAKGAIQKDVVKLLQDAFDRKHMHVKCVALVNDVRDPPKSVFFNLSRSTQTVGTLLSRAYTAGGCALGAIFGTGTNGAYVERLANITKLKETHPEVFNAGGDMVVNCEWGAFNQSVSPLCSRRRKPSLSRFRLTR